ncbi:hypothetical protein ACQR16_18010 [Bradyrhizobium oligotrophicum]|uniref:hypothetical protein n=1 Tax=Bradyrhizobium oligotrophicum TaxID=44255 RepID=UPI003EC08C60
MTPQDLATLSPQERLDLTLDLLESPAAEGVALTPAQDAALVQRIAGLRDVHDELEWTKPLLAEAIAEIDRGEGVPLAEVEARLDGLLVQCQRNSRSFVRTEKTCTATRCATASRTQRP